VIAGVRMLPTDLAGHRRHSVWGVPRNNLQFDALWLKILESLAGIVANFFFESDHSGRVEVTGEHSMFTKPWVGGGSRPRRRSRMCQQHGAFTRGREPVCCL